MNLLHSSARRALAASALLALSACSPPSPVPADAGTDAPLAPDAYRPPPPPYTCDADVTHVDGALGVTASVTFDTTMTGERPRDLGACGNYASTAMWARQEIVEYRVPGSGMVTVAFDTRFAETTFGFNTLVQVRSACRDIPSGTFPPTCFDDSAAGDARASGAVTANGGDTLYFVVTGYSDPPAAAMQLDEGVVRFDVTPSANTPPELDDAIVIIVDRPPVSGQDNDPAIVEVVARDTEGPLLGFTLGLTTPRGRVDFNGDGVGDADDVLVFGFDEVLGAGPYTARTEITPLDDGWRIAAYCRTVTCTQAEISVFDRGYVRSAPRTVSVAEGMVVGRDIACDRTNLCDDGLLCAAGFCARP